MKAQKQRDYNKGKEQGTVDSGRGLAPSPALRRPDKSDIATGTPMELCTWQMPHALVASRRRDDVCNN
jgi:hypothetical protein